MIELAPNHKIGLSLANPVLIAAGCGGYGDVYRHLIDLSVFGAMVTNPITLRPRRGSLQPRLVETKLGFILDTGLQNPGVKKVIRHHGKSWRSFKPPIIAHLPADEPDDLRRTARALAGTDTIVAIELGLPPQATPRDVRFWIEAIQAGCMLPLLVKLPLGAPPGVVAAAVDAFADALVIGSPPRGAVRLPDAEVSLSGNLYGPILHHLALHDLQVITEVVDLPLIAAGGIHSVAGAQTFLSAGASAVQLDSLLWIDPKGAEEIAKTLT